MTTKKYTRTIKVALIFVVLGFTTFATSGFADTERAIKPVIKVQNFKTALVIGNSAYKKAPLKNPANDAQDMAAVLQEIGFEVILRTNATQKEMENAIRTFGKQLRRGGIGLFYYAGHGAQIQGRNYLIPVGATIESESDVKYEGVDAGLLLGKMEDAANDLNIVILDACRNNPFARSFRSAEQGLARMDAPKGSLIAYATAPGSVAADGNGKNGVYTKHLIRAIKKPGLTIEQVLKQVRIAVVSESANKQIPWESSSLMGNFYFQPGDGSLNVDIPLTPPVRKIDDEEEMWLLVRNTDNIKDIDLFLEAFPNGRLSKHAKLKRNQLVSEKKTDLVEYEPVISFSTNDYKVTDIRFFEAGDTEPAAPDRKYSNIFSQETSKRIYTEIKIENYQYKKKRHNHTVKWIYYNPDGSLRGEMTGEFNIKAEWENAWTQKGWGWSDAGNWPKGQYKVKILIDNVVITKKEFYIRPALSDYQVTAIRFFEAGDMAPDESVRQYSTQFSQGKTKRIWSEVKIKNFRYNEKPHDHTVKWIYYNQDGSIRCNMENDFHVKNEWQNAWTQKGWGWSDAGNWPKGNYKVKVFIDGLEIDEKRFSIN